MSIRYFTGAQLKRFEVTMQLVPGTYPRGGGSVVVSRYKPTAADCDCRFCLYADLHGRCALDYCACEEERAAAGLTNPHEYGGYADD
ncbi:MAG: hypothetical protein LBT12_07030 [Oscillospiraceae bacterium]|nr:hypothetical protein [Oscillospiraceae bacterium]